MRDAGFAGQSDVRAAQSALKMLVRQRVIATDLMTIGKCHHRDDPVIPRPETGQAVDPPEAAGVLPAPELALTVPHGIQPVTGNTAVLHEDLPALLTEHGLDRIPPQFGHNPNRKATPGGLVPRNTHARRPCRLGTPAGLRHDDRTPAPSHGQSHSRPQPMAAADNGWPGIRVIALTPQNGYRGAGEGKRGADGEKPTGP